MTDPNRIFIHAHIPNENDTMYLVDSQNKRPSLKFDSEAHGTYEGALDAIVRSVSSDTLYGKVDRRAVEHETSQNEIVYQIQQLGSTAFKAPGYTWAAVRDNGNA